MGGRRDTVAASIEETGSVGTTDRKQEAKPAFKQAGGKVFALDYGRLMGGPFDLCL